MTGDRVPFAVVGTGFWAQHQLNAWREVRGAECIAVVDVDLSKATDFAGRFGVPNVYRFIDDLFANHAPRFVDVISSPSSHEALVTEIARRGADVICQKPLAMDTVSARRMIDACNAAGVALSVHENWRFQRPIRALAETLSSAPIGPIFRASIYYDNSFPVFDNQPTLKDENRFILADMGTHIFDVLRFLFGEPLRLSCEVQCSRDDIAGEDVASVLAHTDGGRLGNPLTVYSSISYASKLENDRFPETRILIEGRLGSIALCDDYWVSVTTAEGTTRRRYAPTYYPWVDSRYEVVHSSMVECCHHLFDCIVNGTSAETNGEDNLKTLRIVDAAYEAAESHTVVTL